jgi:hypothetical protein
LADALSYQASGLSPETAAALIDVKAILDRRHGLVRAALAAIQALDA